MVVGTVFYKWIDPLSFAMPYLLFLMLLFTFVRITPRDLKFSMLHLWLVLIQLLGSLALYVIFRWAHVELAEGLFICVLAPTATASAVITGILGGSVSFITGYVIVSNMAVSITAPLMFSFIGVNRGMPFIESVMNTGGQILPLLVLPLLLAWLIGWGAPRLKGLMIRMNKISLYLWAVSLVVVTGRTVGYIMLQDRAVYGYIAVISLAVMVVCCGQFMLGRYLGGRYGDKISAGQGLGQKNTVLAIWMSHIYLSPLASIAPSSYILWQNIINSYQIWRQSRKK